MANVNFTEKQIAAITSKSKNILVSAAAGSGKTSVLASRITSLVEEGHDIRNMLVVTFTQKAARQMKARIRRELLKRSEENTDRHLALQAEEIDYADICTIHSFAVKIIKENYSEMNLFSDIHAFSDTQIEILKSEAMENLISEMYEKGDPVFIELRDRFSGRTEDKFVALINRLYAFCVSQPEGIDWIVKKGIPDIDNFIRFINENNRINIGKVIALSDQCLKLDEISDFPDKHVESDENDNEFFRSLQKMYEDNVRNYEEMVLTYKMAPLFRNKITDTENKELLKKYRDGIKKIMEELRLFRPYETECMLKEEFSYQKEIIEKLHYVLKAYKEKYTELKMKKHGMDYDDMLLLAYGGFRNPDILEKYNSRYEYVFIDEYQDTNPLQDALLGSLNPSGGFFFVGDMKQSIYRFRMADPMIFSEKSNSSALEVIKMNNNFRSDNGVINSINYYMKNLMSEALGEIDYTDEEKMIYKSGETSDYDDFSGVELLITDVAEENEKEGAQKESKAIASRIREILEEKDSEGNNRYNPGDICILLRSNREYANIYVTALLENGYEVQTDWGTGTIPFVNGVFINLLNVIDGYTSDIALLSVLGSFIGNFDEEEFAKIRGLDTTESFANCFINYSEGESALAKKCRDFISKIDRYREYADSMILEEFLIRIKNEEEYDANLLLMRDGEEKQKQFTDFFTNLLSVSKEYSNLYEIILYLENNIESEQSSENDSNNSEAIKIMTIHKSKGLEYPVVFVARLNQKFSTQDSRNEIFLHNNLGIAAKVIDIEERTTKDSRFIDIIKKCLDRDQKSEELRILYVAMTRAKNRLILSGYKKSVSEFMSAVSLSCTPAELLECKNMLDWVLSASARSKYFNDWNVRENGTESLNITHTVCEVVDDSIEEEEEHIEINDVLKEISSADSKEFYRYRNIGMPVKIGVSSLMAQDEEGKTINDEGTEERNDVDDRGAELGTLLHLFMEHIDFRNKTIEDLRSLTDRLVSKKIISDDEIKRIEAFYPNIVEFLNSDIAQRIANSNNVMREIPFALMVEASELGYSSSEKVILNGIIDLAFEENGKFIIVDYKSNIVNDRSIERLAGHYSIQMNLYKKALEEISGTDVKETYLWFLRINRKYRIH